jgi:hypothetical protein
MRHRERKDSTLRRNLIRRPRADPGRRDTALKQQIKAILSRDYLDWIGFSSTRLRRFGYRFDTY